MNLTGTLAITVTLLYLGFHFFVDVDYRPNADDFAGMYYASKGVPGLGYASRFYMEWEGPFLSMVVQGLWMRALSMGVPGGAIIFTIKALLLLSSVYMYSGLIRFLSGRNDNWLALLAGAITSITLYLITSSPDEIWHWVMGTVVYIHPLIFLQLALGLLFRKRFVWTVLPLAYLMQSRATYAILLYGFITCITLYAWIRRENWRKSITVANLILLGFFLVYLFAPGNAKRVSSETFDTAHYVHEYRREMMNILISFNLAKMDRLVIGLLAFIPLLPNIERVRMPHGKWWVLLPGVAYLCFVLSHGVVFVYATGYAAWNRVFAMHSFLFFVVGAFYFYVFQQWALSSWRLKGMKTITAIAAALLVFKLYQPFNSQLKAGQAFSKAYDVRQDEIMSYNGTTQDTLFVDALPKPGVLHFWDFSRDAGYWINDDYRMYYNIPFHIALKPQE